MPRSFETFLCKIIKIFSSVPQAAYFDIAVFLCFGINYLKIDTKSLEKKHWLFVNELISNLVWISVMLLIDN